MSFTFPKSKRLKSRKLIGEIFAVGQKAHQYPVLIYSYPVKGDQSPKIGVTVSKKYFKRAVDRNLIKRRLREIYRLNQLDLPNHNLMIVYIGKEILDLTKIEESFLKAIKKLGND